MTDGDGAGTAAAAGSGSDQRSLVSGIGFVTTGLVAVVVLTGGVPAPYALVVGLGVGLAIGNLNGPRGATFDYEQYHADRGQAGRVLDAIGSAGAATLLGGGAVFLVAGREPTGLLAFAVGAIGASIGVYGVFIMRNLQYYRSEAAS